MTKSTQEERLLALEAKKANLTAEDLKKANQLNDDLSIAETELSNLETELSTKLYPITSDIAAAAKLREFITKRVKTDAQETKGLVLVAQAIDEAINAFKERKSFSLKNMDIQAIWFFAMKYKADNLAQAETFYFNVLSVLEPLISILNADVTPLQPLREKLGNLEANFTAILEGVQFEEAPSAKELSEVK